MLINEHFVMNSK